MTKDKISRIICEELNLRIYTALTLEVTRKITELHKTTPNATVALGRTITATALMSAALKPGSEQNISVKFSGTCTFCKKIYKFNEYKFENILESKNN